MNTIRFGISDFQAEKTRKTILEIIKIEKHGIMGEYARKKDANLKNNEINGENRAVLRKIRLKPKKQPAARWNGCELEKR